MTNTAVAPGKQRETPKFEGVRIHRDPRGRFAIRHATNWHIFDIRSDEPLVEGVEAPQPVAAAAPEATSLSKGKVRQAARKAKERRRKPKAAETPIAVREGIGFAPDLNDLATVFTAWAAPLGDSVVAEDLEELRAGVDEGLEQLEDCTVEAASETVLGNLVRFERVYTFRERTGRDDQGAIRKRKQWLLYVDKWLICLTWQGSSAEEYAHYYAMANQSFLTFEIPEALWFYTDRELLATLNTTNTPHTGGASATN